MAGADLSSPEPWQSGQVCIDPFGTETYPLPIQAVQVNVLTAPVPSQWAQRTYGAAILTAPLPPHTQHVEAQDMIPKGSFPVPPQKEQVTSAMLGCVAFTSAISSL